jgi:hypothetical protein
VIRSSGAPGGAGSGTATAAAGPSNGVILGASKSSGSVEPELRQPRDGGKRKREIMERVIKYSRDMSDRRDECVLSFIILHIFAFDMRTCFSDISESIHLR